MKAAVLAGLFALIVQPAPAAEPIRIGADGPLTGGSAPMGISMMRGIELAAKKINADGGLLGRRIVLIERDDKANNDRGAEIAKQFTETLPVDAAVGFVNTGVALAAVPYFEQARIPLIISVATGSMLTREFAPPEYAENYIFRVSVSTDVEAKKIVKIAVARGYRRVAIFADTTAYGKVGRRDLMRALRKYHIVPVSSEKFNIGERDMTPQLNRARALNAGVILTYGIGPELAALANSRAKIGWRVPIIGSWTLSMSNFLNGAGANGDGVITPQTFIEQGDTPLRSEFIREFRAMYRTKRMDSPPAAAQGYDSLLLLAAAIRQAGTVDGQKVRAALDDLDAQVDGVVQTYDHPFTPTNHDPVSTANLIYGVVKHGSVVRLMPESQPLAAR